MLLHDLVRVIDESRSDIECTTSNRSALRFGDLCCALNGSPLSRDSLFAFGLSKRVEARFPEAFPSGYGLARA
jgi:hypothetical protein